MTDPRGEESRPRDAVERVLSLFTPVHAGEGATMLLLAANVFLILTAYYFIKPVREALILSMEGGAELKSYAAAGQSVLAVLFVAALSWLAARLPRRALINAVNLFFISNLVIFYFLAQLRIPLGFVFYLWVGIFNLMVPALFWSLANDVYTVDQGKRLFVIIAFGASMGAVAGGWISAAIVEVVGVYQMLLAAVVLLIVALLLGNVAMAREGVRSTSHETPASAGVQESSSPLRAFQLVIGARYLLLIALLMLVLNLVNTTGEYILGKVVAAEGAARASGMPAAEATEFLTLWIAKFYSNFYRLVNTVGVVVQLLLVSRIIKYLGIRFALLVLPLISLASYAAIAIAPVLGLVRLAKTAENATDYSLQNTVRQALWLPTTREQKYKAKQAIDTFFVRAGDLVSAGFVFVLARQLELPVKWFALVNVGLVVAWLLLAIAIGKEYRKLTGAQGAR